MKFKPTDKEGIFKSLFAAYFVLLLHVFLVAGVGVAVVLFKGVYQYLPWILSGIAALVIALFWIFYLRIKRSSTDIKDVLSHPAFQNRNVEIKLLGGMATFKLTAPGGDNLLSVEPEQTVHLLSGQGANLLAQHTDVSDMQYISQEERYHHTSSLEAGDTRIERRLSELAGLYNRKLINDEEYDMAKKRILFESGILSSSSENQSGF